jgi:hypothetical protein
MSYTFATVPLRQRPLVKMPLTLSSKLPARRPPPPPELPPIEPYGVTPPADAELPPITVAEIAKQTAERYGVTVNEIKSARRGHRLVCARQEAMWRARNETSHSLPCIGRFLGGKDHTTVIYGIRKHEERIAFVKAQAESPIGL